MSHLEALETISVLSFLSYSVHDFVNDLSTLSVFALSVAIASATLSKDHVIGAEELSEAGRPQTVNNARLEVDEDCSGHKAGFSIIKVHTVSSKLQCCSALELSKRTNSVFV